MKRLTFFLAVGMNLLATPENFYKDNKQGYYFYEKNHEDSNSTQKKPKIPKNLDSLYYKDFEKLLDDVKGYAVMHPTKENIAEYMRLQNYAVTKASKFESNWKSALIEDPSLNLALNNPTSTYSRMILDEEQHEKVKSDLQRLSKDIGLAVFVRNEDDIRAKQIKQILETIKADFGLDFVFIYADKNPDFAASKKATNYPDVFLVTRGGDWSRVATGLVVKDDIVGNIVHIAKQKGIL